MVIALPAMIILLGNIGMQISSHFRGQTRVARDEIQEKSIEYIVTIKHGDKSLGFYSFNITPENFFNWVKPKYFNWSKVPSGRFGRKKLTREERELLNEAVLDFGEVEGRTKLFKNIARQFFRFWGYEDSKNPDSLNYRTQLQLLS